MNEYVYALVCPITNVPMYIGRTNDLKTRLKAHIERPMVTLSRWFSVLEIYGKAPTIEILHTTTRKDEDIEFWEGHYICLYFSWGFELLNYNRKPERSATFSLIFPQLATKKKVLQQYAVNLYNLQHHDD